MGSLLAIAVLRFAPLFFLLVFCLTLARIIKEDLVSQGKEGPGPWFTKSYSKKGSQPYYLVMQENLLEGGPRAGERWLVGEKLTVGRDAKNDIVINDPYVSGYHVQILQQGEELWVEDLGSTNGTVLNGTMITEQVRLQPGDYLSIGEVLLGLERGNEHASCSSNPYWAGEAGE